MLGSLAIRNSVAGKTVEKNINRIRVVCVCYPLPDVFFQGAFLWAV